MVSRRFLLLLLPFVASQIPSVCPPNPPGKERDCCPQSVDPCGASLGRGECTNIDDVKRKFNTLSGDAQTVTFGYSAVCQCRGNFDGIDCMGCKPGFTGFNCDVPKTYIRKSYCELTTDERRSLHQAFEAMKTTTSGCEIYATRQFNEYDCFQYVHAQSMVDYSRQGWDFAHRGTAFATWHVEFLLKMEAKLHQFGYNDTLGLPYWPWYNDTCTQQIIADFGGDGDPSKGNEIQSTQYATWVTIDLENKPMGGIRRTVGRYTEAPFPPRAEDVRLFLNMSAPGFDSVPFNIAARSPRNFLEGFYAAPGSSDPGDGHKAMHNRGHFYIGGLMRYINISANDPIFYLHHSMVDCVLQQWREREFLRTGSDPVWGPVSGASQGHNYNDIMYPFFPFRSNADRWTRSLNMGYYCKPVSLIQQQSSLQQGDESRDGILSTITNGLTPLPSTAQPAPSVAVIGAGMSGLSSALLLSNAGLNVEVFEATEDVGGRVQTDTCEFTGYQRSEAGAMRFACSHWAVFRFAELFKLQMRSFVNYNPESLKLLSCLGFPVPRRVLDSDEVFGPELWDRLYDCFGIGRNSIHERQPSGAYFDQAIQPIVEHLVVLHMQGRQEQAWQDVIRVLDKYSVASFLTDYAQWSQAAVDLYITTSGITSLVDVNILEILRDTVGLWWKDDCHYSLPDGSANNPIYNGVTEHSDGLWEFTDGSASLPDAFMPALQDKIHFGAIVTGVEYSTTNEITVRWLGQGGVLPSSKRYDFVIFAVPYTVLRTFDIPSGSFSPSKRQVILRAVSTPATKIMVQIFDRRVVENPSPMVPAQYNHKGVGKDGGGSSVTDRMTLTQLVYPSHLVDANSTREVLVWYSWGQEAAITGAAPAAVQNADVVEAMIALHGPQIAVELVITQDWQTEWSELGALPLNLPGQSGFFYDRVRPERNNTAFAGDDKSRWPGWTQGALVSGVSAAQYIYQQAVSTVLFRTRASESYFLPQGEPKPITQGSNVEAFITCVDGPDDPFSTMRQQLSAAVLPLPAGALVPMATTSSLVLGQIISGVVAVTIAGTTQVLAEGAQYLVPVGTAYSLSTKGFSNASVLETMPQLTDLCTPNPVVRSNVDTLSSVVSTLYTADISNALTLSIRFGFGVAQRRIVAWIETDAWLTGNTVATSGDSVLFSTITSSAAASAIQFSSGAGYTAASLQSALESIYATVAQSFCFTGSATFTALYSSTDANFTVPESVDAAVVGCLLTGDVVQLGFAQELCHTSETVTTCVFAQNATSVIAADVLLSSPSYFSLSVFRIGGVESLGSSSGGLSSGQLAAVIVLCVVGSCLVGYCAWRHRRRIFRCCFSHDGIDDKCGYFRVPE